MALLLSEDQNFFLIDTYLFFFFYRKTSDSIQQQDYFSLGNWFPSFQLPKFGLVKEKCSSVRNSSHFFGSPSEIMMEIFSIVN